jgi:hypothetical protein
MRHCGSAIPQLLGGLHGRDLATFSQILMRGSIALSNTPEDPARLAEKPSPK